jgi:hypothetical protein
MRTYVPFGAGSNSGPECGRGAGERRFEPRSVVNVVQEPAPPVISSYFIEPYKCTYRPQSLTARDHSPAKLTPNLSIVRFTFAPQFTQGYSLSVPLQSNILWDSL